MMPAIPPSSIAEMACPAQPSILSFRADPISVMPGGVRLGEIADLSPLPRRLRLRAAVLRVTAPRGAGTIPLAILSTNLRARMPLLGCWLPPAMPGSVTFRTTRRTRERAVSVASVSPTPPSGVHAGDALSLTSAEGPVRVERKVEALQAAVPGHRLFVRDGAGRISSVRFAVAE